MNNQITYETLNNFQKTLNKSDKYNNMIRKVKSSRSINFNSLTILKAYKEKSFDNRSETVNENDNYNLRKKKNLIKSDNNLIKKRKKLREMDIISTNIQKSSQNLYQPDIFYAGLFNNLINKNYLHYKDSHLYDNKNSCRILDKNIGIEEIKKE